jgi:phospholipid/cholesterol/gamma-HCH transport system substrate-binding protein
MTTTKQQKIRIGLFAVVAGALLGLVLVVFGGLHFWRDRATYTVMFDGSVYGLQSGADVYLNGVRVGSVKDVGIDRRDFRRVRVKIEVDGATPVRADTKAYLQLAGITGLKEIDLRGGTPDAPQLAQNAVIPVGESTLDKLEKQAKDMADQAGELMRGANHIVQNADRVIDQVATPLTEVATTARDASHSLAHATAALDGMIADNRGAVRATLADVQQAVQRTSDLIDNQISGLVGGAGDVITQLRDAVRNDNQQVRAAMMDLRQASRTFKELAREVRQKPSRLLFSSPQPDRKLP